MTEKQPWVQRFEDELRSGRIDKAFKALGKNAGKAMTEALGHTKFWAGSTVEVRYVIRFTHSGNGLGAWVIEQECKAEVKT